MFYFQRPPFYQQWQQTVTRQMPHLSKPQAVVLAMWSFGIAMTGCCGLSTVSTFLASVFEQSDDTLRERLRQWYKDAICKPNKRRTQLVVSESFVPLLRWILSWWEPDEKQLVLAADASNLGQRFTVLLICVVYRGCGLPVAWKIILGEQTGSWQPYWLELLEKLRPGINEDWFVLVTTDRGLYARWFYEAIVTCGWHPFMRINSQGYYRSQKAKEYRRLDGLLVEVGQSWSGRVSCFKTLTLECTLLAGWDAGYSAPWLIVTDLPPENARLYWYGMRSWIECLFKDIKRGGFGWHHTKMKDPNRVERLWLALAVATLWLVSVGGQADAELSSSSLPSMPTAGEAGGMPKTSPPRILSCLRRGYVLILAAIVKGEPIPLGRFIPDILFSGELAPAPG